MGLPTLLLTATSLCLILAVTGCGEESLTNEAASTTPGTASGPSSGHGGNGSSGEGGTQGPGGGAQGGGAQGGGGEGGSTFLPFCDADPSTPGPVTYFDLPAPDRDFYRLPFPNDVRVSGGLLDLVGFKTPGTGLLGFDIVQRYLDEIASTFSGFGVYESIFFRFSGEIDLASVAANANVVDLTTGERRDVYATFSATGGLYICPHWLALRPPQGAPYAEGRTYAAYLTTGLLGAGETTIEAPANVGALLSTDPPDDGPLVEHWLKYQPLRAHLAAEQIDLSEILNATVFTVGRPTDVMEQAASAVAAADAPTATAWTLCDGVNVSPCSDTTDTRACPDTPDPDFDELHALITLSIFQSGTAPYYELEDGGGLELDGTGTPILQRTEQVCMALAVPKGPPPPGGWPTVVFAHGTGSGFRTHVIKGIARDFGIGVSDGYGETVKAAVLGIDQVQTGPRRNGSTQSEDALFYNFTNPRAARGNVQQGGIDQLSLARFVETVYVSPAESPNGEEIALRAPPVFFGHSQGASEGGVMLPSSTYAAAVFAGQGACLMDALVTKTSPIDIPPLLPVLLLDVDPLTGRLPGSHDPAHPTDTDQNHPVLNLIQMYIAPADPLSFARAVAKEPLPGHAPRSVFQIYGLGDTYSPAMVQVNHALAAGLELAEPESVTSAPEPVGTLTPIPVPVSGNLIVSGGPVTAAVRQYVPDPGDDGHHVYYKVETARADARRFLAGQLSGQLPKVGPNPP